MISGLLSRPPEEGARLLALSFLDQAAEARPRLADPADAEGLHDFRVGLRRLRSCLKAYRAYLAQIPKKLDKRLRRLAGATGPGRDTEVQIDWLRGRASHLSSHHRAGLSWLLARLAERKRDAYDGPGGRGRGRVRPRWRRSCGPGSPSIAPRSASTPRTPAPPSPRRPPASSTGRWRTSRATSPASTMPAAETQAHEARIRAKRVRYLLEPLAR